MKSSSQLSRFAALAVLGLAAAEVLIMITPFAGFFYSTIHFEPFLGMFSKTPRTAWLDGFFLNHAVITGSSFLEWQRTIGEYGFAMGMWGFFISAFQVYGNKITKRGVAKGFLYRFVRHPQYLCLSVAGLGLLTIWPRFLLIGIWVTMMFLYAGLARFEEQRMGERFGDDYRRFAATRGGFLPYGPVHSLFERTFGRLRPRAVGWATAYVVCLVVAFWLGFVLQAYTRSKTAIVFQPQHHAVVVSAWPKSEAWMKRVFEKAVADPRVKGALRADQEGRPVVATILPPRYRMKGMFYKASPEQESGNFSLAWMGRIAVSFLLPIRGLIIPDDFMGVDPDSTNEPVQVVFSRAEKAYKESLDLTEAVDPGVRLRPCVVVDIVSSTGEVSEVLTPLPQNRWGPNVIMPIL